MPSEKGARTGLERRVVEHLIGLHGISGKRREEEDRNRQNEGEEGWARLHGYSAAGTAATLACARFGAPTRKRRSERDTAPPKNITSAPSQMRRTSGLE
jgi:hypothetical protein